MSDALAQAFAHDELVIVEAMAPGPRSSAGCSAAFVRRAPGRARPRRRWPLSPAKSCTTASGMTSTPSTRQAGWRLRVPAPISPGRRADRQGGWSVRVFERGRLPRAGTGWTASWTASACCLNELNTMPGFTRDERLRHAAGRDRRGSTPSSWTACAGSRWGAPCRAPPVSREKKSVSPPIEADSMWGGSWVIHSR